MEIKEFKMEYLSPKSQCVEFIPENILCQSGIESANTEGINNDTDYVFKW